MRNYRSYIFVSIRAIHVLIGFVYERDYSQIVLDKFS